MVVIRLSKEGIIILFIIPVKIMLFHLVIKLMVMVFYFDLWVFIYFDQCDGSLFIFVF
jgi:hypothetical protein